jgi:ribosome-associated toxin RatA of RatAB toxin-antitoxin module
MKNSIWTKILILSFVPGLLPCKLVSAGGPEQGPDPGEIMSVTIDRHIIGPDDDPSVLRELCGLGELIIINRQPGEVPWLASAGILMNAPIEKAYQAITEFSSYPQFMPQTEGARIKQVGPDLYDVEFDIVVRIVYIPVKVTSAIYHYNQAPFRTDWAAKMPEYNLNYGYWQLVPVDRGSRTMAFYSLYTKINQGVAKRILEMEDTLEMMAAMSTSTLVVRAMKDRAELLHRTSGGKLVPPKPPSERTVLDVLRDNPAAVQTLGAGGRLLVIEETEPVLANVALVLNQPTEKVWDWLMDVEGQAGNDPHLKVELLERNDCQMRARFEWEVNLVLTFRGDYVLEYDLDRPHRITWQSIPGMGSIQGMRGSWNLIPLQGGARTLAVFRNTFELKSLGFLMKALLRIEPTFELAIQASQNLAVVENLEQCLTLSTQERREIMEQRTKAMQDIKEMPIKDVIDLRHSSPDRSDEANANKPRK